MDKVVTSITSTLNSKQWTRIPRFKKIHSRCNIWQEIKLEFFFWNKNRDEFKLIFFFFKKIRFWYLLYSTVIHRTMCGHTDVYSTWRWYCWVFTSHNLSFKNFSFIFTIFYKKNIVFYVWHATFFSPTFQKEKALLHRNICVCVWVTQLLCVYSITRFL